MLLIRVKFKSHQFHAQLKLLRSVLSTKVPTFVGNTSDKFMEVPCNWARKMLVISPIWRQGLLTKRESLVQSNPDYGGDVGTTFLIFGRKVSLNLMTPLVSLILYIPPQSLLQYHLKPLSTFQISHIHWLMGIFKQMSNQNLLTITCIYCVTVLTQDIVLRQSHLELPSDSQKLFYQ